VLKLKSFSKRFNSSVENENEIIYLVGFTVPALRRLISQFISLTSGNEDKAKLKLSEKCKLKKRRELERFIYGWAKWPVCPEERAGQAARARRPSCQPELPGPISGSPACS